ILFDFQTVRRRKLLASGSRKLFPNHGSINNAVVAGGSVQFPNGWSIVQTLEGRGAAEILPHLLSLNGVYNLLRRATKDAREIQRLLVCHGQECFFDNARI